MRDAQQRNRPPAMLTTAWLIGAVLVAGLLVSATAPVRADEPAASATTKLLTLMGIDDQLLAQLRGVLKLRCARYPVEQREQCATLGAELLRDMEGNQLARLMTPFFDRSFTTSEIEALTEFYASPEGKMFVDITVLGSYYRITEETPKGLQPIDQATKDLLEVFLQSGVGKKFTELLPQFTQEKDKQAQDYLCTVLREERHKNVRSILPVPCST